MAWRSSTRDTGPALAAWLAELAKPRTEAQIADDEEHYYAEAARAWERKGGRVVRCNPR